jgi:hypothetical protein
MPVISKRPVLSVDDPYSKDESLDIITIFAAKSGWPSLALVTSPTSVPPQTGIGLDIRAVSINITFSQDFPDKVLKTIICPFQYPKMTIVSLNCQ